MKKIDKDISENKVEVNNKIDTLEVAILKINKDINGNKVEVNNKIESLLSRMNLDKLESN
jgi:hypothetical protein